MKRLVIAVRSASGIVVKTSSPYMKLFECYLRLQMGRMGRRVDCLCCCSCCAVCCAGLLSLAIALSYALK